MIGSIMKSIAFYRGRFLLVLMITVFTPKCVVAVSLAVICNDEYEIENGQVEFHSVFSAGCTARGSAWLLSWFQPGKSGIGLGILEISKRVFQGEFKRICCRRDYWGVSAHPLISKSCSDVYCGTVG